MPSPLAQAIANAEGFNNGSAGTSLNNPGDIMSNGQLVQYNSLSEGWAALENQISKWMNGSSAYAGPNTTIEQLAATYTGNDNASQWASAVSQHLGITPQATLAEAAGINQPAAPNQSFLSQAGAFLAGPGSPQWNAQGWSNNAIGGAAELAAGTGKGSGGLLSSRLVMGIVGLVLIAAGAFSFDKGREIIENGARSAAEVAA